MVYLGLTSFLKKRSFTLYSVSVCCLFYLFVSLGAYYLIHDVRKFITTGPKQDDGPLVANSSSAHKFSFSMNGPKSMKCYGPVTGCQRKADIF